MKLTILIFFCIAFFFACSNPKKIVHVPEIYPVKSTDTSGKLSSFDNDTAKYLANLVKNKQKYIDKPLSVFLADLEVPIISFVCGPAEKKAYNAQMMLQTNDGVIHYDKISNKQPAFEIYIVWKTLQLMSGVRAVQDDNFKNGKPRYEWSQNAKEYFGQIIVGNMSFTTNN
jgi:hypothetical protein